MLCKLVTVAGLCFCAALANAPQCGASRPSHIVDRRVRADAGQRSTHLVGPDDRLDPPEP